MGRHLQLYPVGVSAIAVGITMSRTHSEYFGDNGYYGASPEQSGNPQSRSGHPRAKRKSPERSGHPQSRRRSSPEQALLAVIPKIPRATLYTAKKIGASRLGSSEKVWFNNQEFDYIKSISVAASCASTLISVPSAAVAENLMYF